MLFNQKGIKLQDYLYGIKCMISVSSFAGSSESWWMPEGQFCYAQIQTCFAAITLF